MCYILVEKEELVLNMVFIWECFDGLTDKKLNGTKIVFLQSFSCAVIWKIKCQIEKEKMVLKRVEVFAVKTMKIYFMY
jgi:hypothetical protein